MLDRIGALADLRSGFTSSLSRLGKANGRIPAKADVAPPSADHGSHEPRSCASRRNLKQETVDTADSECNVMAMAGMREPLHLNRRQLFRLLGHYLRLNFHEPTYEPKQNIPIATICNRPRREKRL
ncbi:hypothetical protein KL86PLE_130510 [uncultured Pleomorphomonas sp.]|uniref:Uncharacterized protein n=1 Tax=uncultured Pleomorphomonas sp. TaxID=442121 RepID=A0A212KXP2_9HYPH|nr:hypothetical protein KL86PLE_10026 [uncultured Pleomorphomonas sp.]SCM75109.1 hypothetical protein KL86PLE_130510 [uncultured Pleomorphomonas sp.]